MFYLFVLIYVLEHSKLTGSSSGSVKCKAKVSGTLFQGQAHGRSNVTCSEFVTILFLHLCDPCLILKILNTHLHLNKTRMQNEGFNHLASRSRSVRERSKVTCTDFVSSLYLQAPALIL